jgi:cytochrome c biogenesis protein CcdA
MTLLGRIALFLGLALLVVAIFLGILNFVKIRDYLVALSSNRSLQFYDVNPRVWITYLIAFGAGLFLGLGATSRSRRRGPE